jgi:hypothetical protein
MWLFFRQIREILSTQTSQIADSAHPVMLASLSNAPLLSSSRSSGLFRVHFSIFEHGPRVSRGNPVEFGQKLTRHFDFKMTRLRLKKLL